MANRDYYGNNVHMHLIGETLPQQQQQQQQQQPPHVQEPSYGYAQSHQYQHAAPPPYTEYTYTEPAATYQQPEYNDTKDPTVYNQNYPNTEEGEKGLGSTIVGGAGGAFVSHQVGKKSDHGTLGAIGGAVIGAIGANMASNMVKEHNSHGTGDGHSSCSEGGYGRHGLGGRLMDRKRARLERRLDRLY
ncbi:hypothetical protein BDV19DRAFT_394928 [Aspergillus venezuelensis]